MDVGKSLHRIKNRFEAETFVAAPCNYIQRSMKRHPRAVIFKARKVLKFFYAMEQKKNLGK